jgi:hypothetical protein
MTLSTTSRTGAAATHLVCADLLLAGHSAFIAPEGARYDLVLDVDGALLRVQTKGSGSARGRKSRPEALKAYEFATTSGHRPDKVGAAARIRRYARSDVDIMAFVAVDIRAIAYYPLVESLADVLWFYPPGTPPLHRGGKRQRRVIDQYPIDAALHALFSSDRREPPQVRVLIKPAAPPANKGCNDG